MSTSTGAISPMIRRDAEEKVRELARGFPAVSVIGSRQSGKTTLVKTVFPDLPYVSYIPGNT